VKEDEELWGKGEKRGDECEGGGEGGKGEDLNSVEGWERGIEWRQGKGGRWMGEEGEEEAGKEEIGGCAREGGLGGMAGGVLGS